MTASDAASPAAAALRRLAAQGDNACRLAFRKLNRRESMLAVVDGAEAARLDSAQVRGGKRGARVLQLVRVQGQGPGRGRSLPGALRWACAQGAPTQSPGQTAPWRCGMARYKLTSTSSLCWRSFRARRTTSAGRLLTCKLFSPGAGAMRGRGAGRGADAPVRRQKKPHQKVRLDLACAVHVAVCTRVCVGTCSIRAPTAVRVFKPPFCPTRPTQAVLFIVQTSHSP